MLSSAILSFVMISCSTRAYSSDQLQVEENVTFQTGTGVPSLRNSKPAAHAFPSTRKADPVTVFAFANPLLHPRIMSSYSPLLPAFSLFEHPPVFAFC